MTDTQLLEWVLDDNAKAPSCASPLAEITPAQTLIDRTLELVDAEWRTPPRRSWQYAGVGLALAAGLVLAVQLPSLNQTPASIDKMTPKGMAASAPEVGLKMAVSSQGRLARVEKGVRYSAGDQIYFRVSSTQAGWVYLVHGSEDQVELLSTQHVPAGETDLGDTTSVLSWTIEAGDPASTFAVIGSLDPIPAETLLRSLQADPEGADAANSQRTCTRARSMGWSCAIQAMEGSP